MGHGERLLHLGENLTLDSLEIDSDVESCLWKVYLGGSSEEVHLEGSNGSMVGQREMLAWDTVNDESIPQGPLELDFSLSQTEARGPPIPSILASSGHWLQVAPTGYSCEPRS